MTWKEASLLRHNKTNVFPTCFYLIKSSVDTSRCDRYDREITYVCVYVHWVVRDSWPLFRDGRGGEGGFLWLKI